MKELLSQKFPLLVAKKVREESSGSLSDLVKVAKIDPKRDFRFADLRGVKFEGFDLDGADFFHADLTGASFIGAHITSTTNFESATVDSVTWNDDRSEVWYNYEAVTFGDRISAARDALGLSQAELAKNVGVKLTTLQSWEDDLSEPRANKLQMLSGVLNVSLTWLLSGEGEGIDTEDLRDSEVASKIVELEAQARAILRELSLLRKSISARPIVQSNDQSNPFSVRGRDEDAVKAADAAVPDTIQDDAPHALASLTPREERVLRMRFGIGMQTNQTRDEVAQQFSVTRERIRQIEAKALSKLTRGTAKKAERGKLKSS